jgi:hypothetical protein
VDDSGGLTMDWEDTGYPGQHEERTVLGLAMRAGELPDGLDMVASLRAIIGERGAFYDVRNARVWRAVLALADAQISPTVQAVVSELLSHPEPGVRPIDPMDVNALVTEAPPATPGGIRYHANQMKGAQVLRQIRETGARFIQLGETRSLEDAEEALQAARDALADVGSFRSTEEHSWSPVDLSEVLQGGTVTTPPRVMGRTDGVMMLYPGRVHSVAGEPEAGKSWVCLAAAAEAMLLRGEHVFYFDYEDTAHGIVSRLRALGVPDNLILALFHYIRPGQPLDTTARHLVRRMAEEAPPSLVILDGVSEAMTMEGLEMNDNSDVVKFYERLPRWMVTLPGETGDGPSVVMIDHVKKRGNEDTGHGDRSGIGGQHKLAGLDGCQFILRTVLAFSPGHPGMSRMYVTKDRHGLVREHARNHVIAELHVNGDRSRVDVQLRPPSGMPRDVSGRPRPTTLMGQIWEWVRTHPDQGRTAIRNGVPGNNQAKGDALEALIREGYLEVRDGGRSPKYVIGRVWDPDAPGNDVDVEQDDGQGELDIDQGRDGDDSTG